MSGGGYGRIPQQARDQPENRRNDRRSLRCGSPSPGDLGLSAPSGCSADMGSQQSSGARGWRRTAPARTRADLPERESQATSQLAASNQNSQSGGDRENRTHSKGRI